MTEGGHSEKPSDSLGSAPGVGAGWSALEGTTTVETTTVESPDLKEIE